MSSNDKIPLIDFTTPCTYTIWARSYPGNAAGDSLYVGLGEQTVSLTGFEPGDWGWANQAQTGGSVELTIAQSGLYTLSVVMREDGLRLDRLLLTTNTTYLPTGFGPVESVRQTSQMTGALTTLQRTVTYNYDKLYHLTSANYTSGEQYSYTYDPVGNRLQQIINGDTTGYLYDAADRLTSVNGQTYAFDDNGNLLTTGAMTNTWDAANRLIEATNAGATLQPIYDGQGNRVAQTSDLITTSFALDVQGLPEVIYTSDDNAYLHLPGIIMTESATGTVRYLLSDGLGSVRQAVDEGATVVSYKEFDPYGNLIENRNSEIVNRYGFTGEWWEDEVGLLYLRARWYLPEDGVFLSRDVMEGEPPYAYVRGNPVNRIDPNGMQPPTPGPTPGPTLPPPPPPPQPTPPPRPVEGTPVPPGPIPPPVSTPPPLVTCPPLTFSAGGYAEGWSGSTTALTIVTWQEGSEIVYDFATMERARFTYKGVPYQEGYSGVGVGSSGVELAATWYATNLNGFDNDNDLENEYSGRFTGLSLGVGTPLVELQGGLIYVWSPEVTGVGYFELAGLGLSSPGVSGSLTWTDYVIAEPGDLPFKYGTGGIVLKRDYRQMRNDIVTGAHVPPHPNEGHPLFPRITMLRQLAALELDLVWSSYYAPLLHNHHSPMR